MSKEITILCKNCGLNGAWSDDVEYPKCFDCQSSDWITLDINVREFRKMSNEKQDEIISTATGMSIEDCQELRKQQFDSKNQKAKEELNSALENNKNNVISKLPKPKCPTCGSTNIQKISTGKKAIGFAMVGVFSSNFGKTMECKDCGYKW